MLPPQLLLDEPEFDRKSKTQPFLVVQSWNFIFVHRLPGRRSPWHWTGSFKNSNKRDQSCSVKRYALSYVADWVSKSSSFAASAVHSLIRQDSILRLHRSPRKSLQPRQIKRAWQMMRPIYGKIELVWHDMIQIVFTTKESRPTPLPMACNDIQIPGRREAHFN